MNKLDSSFSHYFPTLKKYSTGKMLSLLVLLLLATGVLLTVNQTKNQTSTTTSAQTTTPQVVWSQCIPRMTDNPELQPAAIGDIAGVGKAHPMWCYDALRTGVPDTHTEGPNSWLDLFNHGVLLGEFDTGDNTVAGGYRLYEKRAANDGLIYKTRHWRHNNHWMVDIAPHGPNGGYGLGGTFMRPDRSFKFEDFGDGQGKKMVIEFEVAAGIVSYGNTVWPEFVITHAPQPRELGFRMGGYAGDSFNGSWAFRCMMLPQRALGCAYMNNSDNPPEANYVWRVSGNLNESNGIKRGFENGYDGFNRNAWRVCQNTDPDINCRDRFRFELTKTTLIAYVNGQLFAELRGLSGSDVFTDALVNGDNYVYLADWVGVETRNVIRYHWDYFAINPKDANGRLLSPSAAPNFCLGQPNSTCPTGTTPTSTPLPTSTQATSTPTSTLTPTRTPTPLPTSGQATPTVASCVRKNEGDSNCDGVVGIIDLSVLASTYNSTTDPRSDFNLDGVVNITDLGILASGWD